MYVRASGQGFPAGLLPIVQSLAQNLEVRQRLWRDFLGRLNLVNMLGAGIPGARQDCVAPLGRDWQLAVGQSELSVFFT